LSVSVHTTAMVFQREKIISGNTSAMVEEIEPISLPLRWSNCDGFTEGKRTFLFIPLRWTTAMLLRRGKNVSVHTTAMANCDGFLEEANSISFDNSDELVGDRFALIYVITL
jgi:hypothetical protein